MPRRAVGTSMLSSAGGKAVWGVRWLCPAGREEGINCPRHSRITPSVTGPEEKRIKPNQNARKPGSGARVGYPLATESQHASSRMCARQNQGKARPSVVVSQNLPWEGRKQRA
ncbi:hypothetical protein LF1_00030 [Rubripirellula obstinata]|nr:hypothetical protein LF1_00030 [Rubripirellula obstinata]